MIDRRPGAIARSRDVDDVVACIDWARRTGTELAIRAGGHSVAGVSMSDDGLVIDMRGFDSIDGRSGRAHRARRRRRYLEPLRRRHAGARPRDDRRPRLHDRRRRSHARRRLRLARALVRPGVRQPDRRRARHRGGRAGARERRREPGALLGAPRRRRQLRRRHHARVPAAPGRSDRLRRPRRLRPEARARRSARRSATSTRAAARTRPASCSATSPRRRRSSSRRSGTGSWSSSPRGCGTAPSTRASARSQPLRDVVEPIVDLYGEIPYADAPIDDRRPAREAELVDGRVPRRAARTRRSTRSSPTASRCRSASPRSCCCPWGGEVARRTDTPLAKRDAKWVVHPFCVWDGAERDDEHIAWGRACREVLRRGRPAASTSTSSATRARTACGRRSATPTSGSRPSRSSTTRRTSSAATRTSGRGASS